MRPYDKLVKKMREGKTIYLLNKLYSTALKCDPDTTHYKAKHMGGGEYDIERSADLVCDAFEDITEITEEEYEQY